MLHDESWRANGVDVAVCIGQVLSHPKIEVKWDSAVESFVGDEASGLTAVSIKHVVTGSASTIAASAAFVAIGHIPNTQIFEPLLRRDEQGYIERLEGGHSTRTSVDGLFVCGDASDKVRLLPYITTESQIYID
jgi:thioredoxin reductase (NADPH)